MCLTFNGCSINCQDPPHGMFTHSWAIAGSSPQRNGLPFDLCVVATTTTIPPRLWEER